jgi:hypothetical protein
MNREREEMESEWDARYDYLSEAYGPTARDAAKFAEDEMRELVGEAERLKAEAAPAAPTLDPSPVKITVRYRSIDRYSKSYRYKTRAGAAAKIRELLGDYFDIGSTYAVSGDGVGRVTLSGATFEELGFRS